MPDHPFTHYTDGCRYNLINERLARDLTQRQMAKRLNICRSAYAQIENGLRTGGKDVWDKLAEMFDKPQHILQLTLSTKSKQNKPL